MKEIVFIMMLLNQYMVFFNGKYMFSPQLTHYSLVLLTYIPFFAHQYQESMRSWFGKAGNGMHVLCIINQIEEPSDEADKVKIKNDHI